VIIRKNPPRKPRKSKGAIAFAWLPKKMDNGDIIWLRHYNRHRTGYPKF